MPTGPTNSMLDVDGVGVGHTTVWRDEPPPPAGRGVARTGVTVVDPGGNLFAQPVAFGGAVLNGAGECTGFIAGREWGLLETPVYLTSTMQLGRVYDAACRLMVDEYPEIGADDVVIPVVAECDDSFLSEARRMQVEFADVEAALGRARASAGSPQAPDEGAVGSGTGMSCLGYKGGIGSSSRVTPSGHTVGVLVMANFGDHERLTIDGVPVGRLLPDPAQQSTPPQPVPGPAGSCIVVVGTDAPLDPAGCQRVARRAGLGLARTGSTAHHGSGEIFVCFATGRRGPRDADVVVPPVSGRGLDDFFGAVVDATEEAVLNVLFGSPTVVGREGHVSHGLPVDDVLALLRSAGRLG
jgi:D-aminopeptidase